MSKKIQDKTRRNQPEKHLDIKAKRATPIPRSRSPEYASIGKSRHAPNFREILACIVELAAKYPDTALGTTSRSQIKEIFFAEYPALHGW
jgi:hypothetical protein